MAKKAKSEDVIDSGDIGMAAIRKKYGDIVRSGTELFDEKSNKSCVSVSPAYDLGLNGGILEGSWTVISGIPKCGKAQPLDCAIYTPSGKRLMGDLAIGDVVSTPNGGVAKIKAIYEQGVKDVYLVTFNDGSSTRCCKEHLWRVSRNIKSPKYITYSLEDIQKFGLKYTDRDKWKIPMTTNTFFDSQDIPLDPYLLGSLIGDGGLTHRCPIFTNNDEELVETIRETVDVYNTKLVETGKYGYRITSKDKSLKKNEVTCHLKALGLMGLGSHDKFIPDIYKYNSVSVRLEIIRGLLDTDGHSRRYAIEYSTVSIRLAEDVKEILESLGCKVIISKRFTSCNGKRFPSYRLSISSNKASELFKLSRKRINPDRTKRDIFRSIKSIEYLSREECRCIELDDSDHLYLTDNFIVTHNSSLTLQIIANAQKTGRRGVYADAESRVKAYNLSGTHDLNQSEIEIISGKDEDLSAEDILNTVNAMIRMPKNKGCVCVIDSTSSLLPRDEMDAEVSSKLRAQLPKMLSHWVKQNAQVVVRNDIIMILITHYITNTSGYGKHKLADCGVMVQYQADNRFDFTHVEPWEESGKKIGQKTICDISCSAMGASGNSVTSYLRFGHGIDFTKEFIELGESFGLIEKAGAWFTLPYLAGTPDLATFAEQKFQGQQKVYDFISSTPLASEILKKEITTLLS
jgi:RecA/RadA recombinase